MHASNGFFTSTGSNSPILPEVFSEIDKLLNFDEKEVLLSYSNATNKDIHYYRKYLTFFTGTDLKNEFLAQFPFETCIINPKCSKFKVFAYIRAKSLI